jgi:diacylglycerol kinase (ATP)
MSGIGVVLNPKSRHNLRDPGALDRFAALLGDSGLVRAAHSIEDLYRIAEDFRRLEIDVLAIGGGDGTAHVTLGGFLEVYGHTALPQIALLRGGTMNTVATSVGVRRDSPDALLKHLVSDYRGEWIRKSQRGPASLRGSERSVMRITADGRKALYGFLFGAGVIHGFLAEYYRADPTPLAAAAILARGVSSALTGGQLVHRMTTPLHGSVELEDDERWPERDYLAVAAGTIAHIGLGFRPFHRHAARPPAFHALGIYAPVAVFVRELPRIYRGLPMRKGRAYEAVSSRMVVRTTAGPLRYMIDGDLHEAASEVVVSAGPVVRLVLPGAPTDGARGLQGGAPSLAFSAVDS